MADFSTGAELEISVSQSSLSDARDTIESELGNMEVDVNAIVSGGGNQPRDPSSGQFMSMEGVEQRVVNTNDTLDSLIQIENERWELDKLRNDYLEELSETGVLPGGGGGGGGGGGAGSGILQGLGIRSLLGGAALGGGATAAGAIGLPLAGGALGSLLQGQSRQRLPEGATTSPDNVVSGTGVTQSDLQASRDFQNRLSAFATRNTGQMVSGTSVNAQNVEPTVDMGDVVVNVTTDLENAVDDAVRDVEDVVNREVERLERRVSDAVGGGGGAGGRFQR